MREAPSVAICAASTDRHLGPGCCVGAALPVLLDYLDVSTQRQLKVGVLGATGYVGLELLRLLLDHPGVGDVLPGGQTSAGASLRALFPQLDSDAAIMDVEGVLRADTDVLLCAAPTEVAADLGRKLLDGSERVIDLSGAHRLAADAFESAYGRAHPDADAAAAFATGLVELDAPQLLGERAFAVPGCFSTAVLLGVLPLARAGLLQGRIRVVGATGSSGGGRALNARAHHPQREGNLSPYRVLEHQHAPEIEAVLAPSFSGPVDFVPVSAPLRRGILATCFVEPAERTSEAELRSTLESAYAEHPLVRLLGPGDPEPSVGRVAGTMHAEIGWALDARGGGSQSAVVNVAIDNLIRGGAGHGVQAMNAMMGWPRDVGLTRRAAWP